MLFYASADSLTLILTLSISLSPHTSFSPSAASQFCNSYTHTHTHISTCQTCTVFSEAAGFILTRHNSLKIVFEALQGKGAHSLRNYTVMTLFPICSAEFTFYICHKCF